MKKKALTVYKATAWLVVFVQLVYILGLPYSVDAVTMPIPSTVLTAATLEEIANLAQQQSTTLTDDQLRDQASANKKIDGPQVIVKFNQQNVTSGQKITAEARTTGFTNADEKLYFTWYLKHKSCGLDNNPDDDVKKICDADGNGRIEENDWKVEAMHMVARGNFDSATASYGGNKDEKSDGYDAYFGNEIANGNDEEAAACYFQDFTTGRMFELAKIEPEFTCPTGSHQQCVSDVKNSTYQKTDPLDPSQPPAAPTLPLVAEIEKNICQAQTNNTSSKDMDDPTCKFVDEDDIDIFKLSSICANGTRAVCIPDNGKLDIKSDATTTFGNIFSQTYADSTNCNNSTSICALIGLGIAGPTCANMFSTIDTAKEDASKSGEADPNAAALATCDYEKKSEAVCKHLFPEPSKGSTGDGKFTMDEEEFWGTNPLDPKTAKNQNVDEANVVGLGMNTFSWEYRAGDKLGVVVEGTFTKETQHADGSKMVMWALPNGVCEAFEDEAENKGFYTDEKSIKKILAVDFDIDKCLEDNLLDPSGAGNLTVDVNYSPSDNLINDPEGGVYSAGTVLNLKANVSGFTQNAGTTTSANNFYYNWKFEVTNSKVLPPINSDPWIDVTSKVKKANPTLRLEGVGLDQLALPLNIPEEAFAGAGINKNYIRVKVEVEQLQEGGGLRGKGTAIIKFDQQDGSKGILMYPVSADSAGRLTLAARPELCSDAAGRYLCYVTENEVVGLMVNKNKVEGPYSWTLNGKPLSCTADMSGQCADGNVVFFPAIKNEDGTEIKITLTAKDEQSGSFVTKERYFQIVAPGVAIDSANYNSLKPKLFGYYKGIDGGKTADYSDIVYEVVGNGNIVLKALFYPQWKADQSELEWYLNGSLQSDFLNKTTMEIDPTGIDELNVDLRVAFKPGLENQVNNLRKALWKHWQISPTETTEINGTASIRIENNYSSENLLTQGKKQWFGAMLSSHVATQVMFLVRLLLTTLVIIFVTGLIFAIMPGEYKTKEIEY